MYQNIHFEKKYNSTDIIHIWDDERGYFTFPYQKYAYKKDKNGKFVALDGSKLRMIQQWDNTNMSDLYESDVNPEVRTLIDLYHESDRPSVNHVTMFFDIEVSIKGGYPDILEADKEIISIAYHLKEQKHSTILILDESDTIKEMDTPEKRIITFKNEATLLSAFLDHVNLFNPTILSGWNSDGFDIPYMYRRLVKVLGKRKADSISPIGKVKEYGDNGFSIVGISSLDYMRIYKMFTQGERSSYALDFISKAELDRGKVAYDGTLEDLYRSDINKFIDYNLEDVLLLRDLDIKLNFIALAQAICHKGHVPYENIHSTSMYLDGAALTYMKRVGVVAPNKKPNFKFELQHSANIGDTKLYFLSDVFDIPAVGKLKIFKTKSSKFSIAYKKYTENCIILEKPLTEQVLSAYEIHLELPGAYVQEPKPGLYDWVYDLDLTSLYPCCIMSLNISQETKMGRIIDWNPIDWNNNVVRSYTIQIKNYRTKYNSVDLQKHLQEKNYSIAANGVFYRQDITGFLPTILSIWFDERAEFKSKRDKFGDEGNTEKYDYYDIRQMVLKTMLNSFYGVLALPSFRFYDVDNAEAITSTGVQIIKFTKKAANHYYKKYLKDDKDYVIYIDTDSIFCSALPLVKKLYPNVDVTNDAEMTEKIVIVAKRVQQYINETYDVYAKKYHRLSNHRFNIKQEVISKAGFWVAKKRYAQLMIYKEGLMVNELDVKGIDVVRSDFPNAFKTFFKRILLDILNKADVLNINKQIIEFRKYMKTCELTDIMFPTGVKDVNKYNPVSRSQFETIKGSPIHVKSSLLYNDYLDYLGLNTGYITNGTKIKWAYLMDNNPMQFDTLAIMGSRTPKQIIDYIEKYIDYDKTFKSKLQNKLEDFYSALNWGSLNLNENVNKFFQF